jgi:hypothetical protein
MSDRTKFWILLALLILSISLLVMLQRGANAPGVFQ